MGAERAATAADLDAGAAEDDNMSRQKRKRDKRKKAPGSVRKAAAKHSKVRGHLLYLG